VLKRLSDIEAEPVDWLWEQYIAYGVITLIVGDPGESKSTVTLDLGARVSRKDGTFPDDQPAGGPIAVVYSNAEDVLKYTIKPRLIAAGANDTVITALYIGTSHDGERLPDLSIDLPLLEEAIVSQHAKLVVLDPLSAFLGKKTDAWKDADVRRVLGPLAVLAEKHGVAVIGVLHLNKNSQQPKIIHRVMSSIAFTAAARAVFAVLSRSR
jgi:predicted ATP-dependent serine protease